jgi:RNA polymerase sigma factor (sigma-70 family)
VDERQVRDLFEGHWTRTLQFARLLGAADPEDVTAETFARLYDHRGGVESADAGVAYLRRIMINLVRDRGRKAALVRRTGHDTLAASAIHDADPTDGAEVVLGVKSLPQRQREVVVLRFWLDQSERDTAAAMSISVGSVKTHLSRAIKALRPVLEGTRT